MKLFFKGYVPSKKLIIFASLLVLAIGSISLWYFFRLDDSNLTKLEEELSNNKDINTYFPIITIFKNNDVEVLETEKIKMYSYTLSTRYSEEFEELSDSEKQDKIEELSILVTLKGFIECGHNKVCDIEDIYALGSDDNSTSYKYDQLTNELTYSYYDENKVLQTKDMSSPVNSSTENSKLLTLEDTSCKKDNGYIYASGYIKNNSSRTFSYIKIQTDFTDLQKNIIDTNYTYAVGSEGLGANSRKSYEVMNKDSEAITNCYYKIIDYR